jgi:riboflavin synthase
VFTGIITAVGKVAGITIQPGSIRLSIHQPAYARQVALGESVAVNGCCLTVTARNARAGSLSFDLLNETWTRTTFHQLNRGDLVNMERSVRPADRLSGHFVTGHVDGLGTIIRWEKRNRDYYLEIKAAPALCRLIALKGSISLDGISLTVAAVTRTTFAVWIIPFTLKNTALRKGQTGKQVNLETDILAKYVDRLIAFRKESS